MTLGPARTLDDVISVFDPRQPLQGEALTAYYAERGQRVRQSIMTFLRNAYTNPVKILFTGHRGSGKSTELNKLVVELGDRFFVVKVRTGEFVPASALTYVDVILIGAMELFRVATEEQWISRAPAQIVEGVWGDIEKMINNAIFGKLPYRKPAPPAEVGIKVDATIIQGLALEFETRYKNDANTRAQIRESMKDQLSEVINRVNLLAGEIQHRYKRPVLFVYEDTDKLDPGRAGDIFYEHPQTITDFNASVIYTFPIEMRHSERYGNLSRYFKDFRLPNLVLTKRDGEENESDRAIMEMALTRRMDSGLISKGAREKLILASGGIMRYLVDFVQDAALSAITRGASQIDEPDVENAISELRKDFEAMLGSDDYPFLTDRHSDKRLSSDEKMQYLLRMRALLEYENGGLWCDVHPVILPLLEARKVA
jgi:hypothetical protein